MDDESAKNAIIQYTSQEVIPNSVNITVSHYTFSTDLKLELHGKHILHKSSHKRFAGPIKSERNSEVIALESPP